MVSHKNLKDSREHSLDHASLYVKCFGLRSIKELKTTFSLNLSTYW